MPSVSNHPLRRDQPAVGRTCLPDPCNDAISTSGSTAFDAMGSPDSGMGSAPAGRRSFPPEVAVHLVKIACERPDELGRSLSHWDCAELARQLTADHVVDAISPQTVQ